MRLKHIARNGLSRRKIEGKKSAFPDSSFLADANMLKHMLQLPKKCTVPTASKTQLVHHQISAQSITAC